MSKLIRISTLALILSWCATAAHATHNRAGEIIYCNVSGLTYEVTIITHTKTSSPADRNELEIQWGDGTVDTLPRTNITLVANSDAQRNEYVGRHTYLGPGIYTLQFLDPNRNDGVLNIPNSVNEPFCVSSELYITPFGGNNCSVRFLNSPLQDACFQSPWIHNSVAFDPDGDSLSYEPVICKGHNCSNIAGYEFPDEVQGPSLYSIDPITGTITWDSPQLAGEYNLAFKVTEWRNGQKVGSVTRDMQVTVLPCSNQPPELSDLPDTCVVAGTLLSLQVTANDPNGNGIALTALGSPFQQTISPAFFNGGGVNNPATGTFTWQTDCEHVQLTPHSAVFLATDNDATPLVNVQNMNITVVAPAPLNPSATPDVANMILSWDPSPCSNATGYKIYRREGLAPFTPAHCETGVPTYTGYTLIDTIGGLSNTTYVDDNGLNFGVEYCYMVVACFSDGAESYASVEFCNILRREAPILTNASVGVTDPVSGIDTVRWVNAVDLDTVQYPGPYFFELYHGVVPGPINMLIYTSSTFPFLDHPDTSFLHTGIDTRLIAHSYRVELHNNDGFISTSNLGETPFLSLTPDDEELLLTWTDNVPWNNFLFEVFRSDGSQFQLIGTSTTNNYLDTGLVNGVEYCYYVKCIGSYGDPTIPDSLLNFSQENCGIPIDLTPPCPPVMALDNACEVPLNTITWNNPNLSCEDTDTEFYNVYFSDALGGTFSLIGSTMSAGDTSFTHTNGNSAAGCYVVTAIDSVGNESAIADPICGENCPYYFLPNVFTPNQDGNNDFFRPFPYRGVKNVDMQVFNRWGQLIFNTEDPDILWDGTHKDTGELVPEGVYFYTCRVIYVLLDGEEETMLRGYVHMLNGNKGTTN